MDVVKRIFAESIGGRGKYAIARDLNSGARKEPAFQAEAWQPSYIAKVLGTVFRFRGGNFAD